MAEKTITIGLAQYERLIKAEIKYQHIRQALINGATLNYSGEELRFDDDSVQAVLRAIDPEGYAETLTTLQDREKKQKCV